MPYNNDQQFRRRRPNLLIQAARVAPIALAMLLTSCVVQDQNDAKVMKVGDHKYLFSSASATASCTELVTGYLWTPDGKTLLDKAHAAGSTIPCAALAGAVAGAAIGGGIAAAGSDDVNSSSQSKAAASAKGGSAGVTIREHYKPRHPGKGW